MQITFDISSLESYRQFLAVKKLPIYRIVGRTAEFPDEYAERLGINVAPPADSPYVPLPGLFDYQRDIAAMALRKKKFAVFADPGLGKTLIITEFMRHAISQLPSDKCGLIISPLMVVDQTIAEIRRFYGDNLPIDRIPSSMLGEWLNGTGSTSQYFGRLGITNYEALGDQIPAGRLGALAGDETSIMKSMYGEYGQQLIRLGRGLEWKLAATGTPAPNDRIEYANHAVFLDQFPTINSFLARYFVNRGQTDNRWEIKPHALRPFYRSLSHWCIFLTNPAVYGWKDNCGTIPPIETHVHHVEMTDEQESLVQNTTGELFAARIGGITKRSQLARIAKGHHQGESVPTLKYDYIRDLVAQWPNESTIIWCLYNDEQSRLEQLFPEAASISGSTPHDKRQLLIDDFKQRRRRILISKAKVLGFGLNLQVCTRMVFSSLQDSWEMYYQCVKRANRVGSTVPLRVHIPVCDIEQPMIETVMRKAKRIEHDTREQEILFRECSA